VNIFILAHQTVDWKLTILYKSLFGDRIPAPDKGKEIDFLNQQMQGEKDYVVFDESNKYEIDLSSGLKK